MSTSLVRSSSNKMIAGVCGGLARQFNIDANILRVVFVIAALVTNVAGIAVYAALWLFLPTEDGGPTGFDSLKRQFGSSSH
ncbi:MAG: PspC domain-containing protein [Mobilicoccus sp.]|nr:PspC domain-containing protein [Mobilicoccus sp.]